ncbi:MAG: hypothetical protein AB7V55_04010 [Oscillospiraceae bacterium]
MERDADMERALPAIAAMAERSATAQQKFAPGTAQHTLLENRTHALRIAAALIEQALGGQRGAPGFPKAALQKAQAPIASLTSKSEKARKKLAPGSWQHTMLTENIRALRLAAPLLETALGQKETST